MDHRKETVYGNADGSSFVAQHEDARWSKDFSDRDSWVLMRMKEDIVFISHDRRNEHYIGYKGHNFCCASHDDGDKFEVLRKDLKERLMHGDADGDPEALNYVYIGDAPFDYECLKHARYGFIPQDASPLLVKKIFATDCQRHVRQLQARGGEGCIEEAVTWLYQNTRGELSWDVFNDIEKYLGA
jgi:hydroxymethylpyrimidine pyrophosphatase-like HAD family hydrolase